MKRMKGRMRFHSMRPEARESSEKEAMEYVQVSFVRHMPLRICGPVPRGKVEDKASLSVCIVTLLRIVFGKRWGVMGKVNEMITFLLGKGKDG